MFIFNEFLNKQFQGVYIYRLVAQWESTTLTL